MSIPVPVFRPQLPDAARLLPYLRRIDDSRTYTNWGPLVTELEQRLASHFGLAEHRVVSASSGTAALVGAILATAGRASLGRPLAIVPAFTFVATAIAVEQCGYRPYIVDVDPDTWALDPEELCGHPRLDQVGIVVVAAPFGRPIPQESCRTFRRRTGIPIVIDGGASFEALCNDPSQHIGDVPVALSFHATKSFSTGEGGSVVSTDRAVSTLVAQALNFGFHETRNSSMASTNGKMSEYHAAVGLAELDGWREKRHALHEVADRYRTRLAAAGVLDRFRGAPEVAGCYALFEAEHALQSHRLQDHLQRAGVEFRLWYGGGLNRQRYFEDVAQDTLDVTGELSPRVVGLPTAPDLEERVIDQVVSVIVTAIHHTGL